MQHDPQLRGTLGAEEYQEWQTSNEVAPSNNQEEQMSDEYTMEAIGKRILTQDNRATRDPIFCVQVCERVGPMIPGFGGELMFFNEEEQACYYPDDEYPEEYNRLMALYNIVELPDEVIAGGYTERWNTVQVCFTEEGCKDHIERNGHRYECYHGVRIYVDCLFRNPEMIAVREFLAECAAAVPELVSWSEHDGT